MYPPNNPCSRCGGRPYDEALSLETARLNVEIAKENAALKAEVERFKKLIEIADTLIMNEEAKKDWEYVKQLRIM